MSKEKVFVTRPDFDEGGIDMLKEKFDVDIYPEPESCPRDYLLEHVTGAHAILVSVKDTVDKEVLDAAGKQLKVVATMSIGYDHIDVEECKKRKIEVCNCAVPIEVAAVAEYAVTLLLATSRKVIEIKNVMKKGEWIESFIDGPYSGRGLINATVGIVGMGRIGQAVLRRILAFDVSKVMYYDILGKIKAADELGADFVEFEELLKNSEYVMMHLNLTKDNRHMFNAKAFSMMKEGAFLLNTSRGGLIDQDALIEALESKRLRGAAIDVMEPEPLPMDHPLRDAPNLFMTPHKAAAEKTVWGELSKLQAENIIAISEGENPITPVY